MKYTKIVIAFAITILAAQAKAQTRKPNVILILADDVGYKSLNCNGGNLYTTPNIDMLAKKGMRFTQCQASPLCSPSRFMLLTGKYNFRNYTEWGMMDTSQRTIGNMFKDAGYATAFYGKSQLGGEQKSIRIFGFDKFAISSDKGPKYKNPSIYCNYGFLPDSSTNGKYSEDIFTDSLLSFIDANKRNPFFIYYPMVSVHKPFGPTPDDTAFANWDASTSDTAFYASMMKYMDKKIGQIVEKIKSLGLENKTLILFLGDNGTSGLVKDYIDDDTAVYGGKQQTTEAGTHVPLIAYWPGMIAEKSVDPHLIDFTDFLPTLADIGNITVRKIFGPIDGVSFAYQLTGGEGVPRDHIFCHFDHHPGKSTLERWAQTKVYKLYDTSATNNTRLFYNIERDLNEEHPISSDSLTSEEIQIKTHLLNVINGYVKQGKPIISLNPSVTFINASTIVFKDTLKIDGGSTITSSGAVWATTSDPRILTSSHTLTGATWGVYSTLVTGLLANTVYYVRAYASNLAGTAYSNQVIIKTPPPPPVATKATAIDSNQFTANWNAYPNAIGYKLDVSRFPTFTKLTSDKLTEGFNNGTTIPPTGWQISKNIIADSSAYGMSSSALKFRYKNTQVVTPQLARPAKQLKFWLIGLDEYHRTKLLIEGFDGDNWQPIETLTNIKNKGHIETLNATSNPPLAQNFIQFRFTDINKKGTFAIDDVSINYNNTVQSFVTGYKNMAVKKTSQIVTGLQPATTYFYRVRAVTDSGITYNSNVITVITKITAAIDSVADRAVIAKSSDLNIRILPNPSPGEFTLMVQNIKNEKLEISVMDMLGKTIYHIIGDSNNEYKFGNEFSSGEYFVKLNVGKLSKTIKIIKSK